MQSIKGSITMPLQWFAYGPLSPIHPPLHGHFSDGIPAEIDLDGKRLKAVSLSWERYQINLDALFGPPTGTGQAAYLVAEIDSPAEELVSLGFGADFYMEVWVNGEQVINTMVTGNRRSPPTIKDYVRDVRLKKGGNRVLIHFVSGASHAVMAIGGPGELAATAFSPLFPAPPPADKEALKAAFPADPQAPIHWKEPESFDPRIPGLGLTPLPGVEHTVILEAKKSKCAIEDGGDGRYESLEHGTWNHNCRLIRFGTHVIASWNNHSVDEGAPGVRVIGRVATILDAGGGWTGGQKQTLSKRPRHRYLFIGVRKSSVWTQFSHRGSLAVSN